MSVRGKTVAYSARLVEQFKPQLPEHYYLALVHAGRGHYEVAAAKLGVPVGTIKSRLNRGREAMAKLMAAAVHPNGAPKWALDGTLLDEQGNRSTFDDVAE